MRSNIQSSHIIDIHHQEQLPPTVIRCCPVLILHHMMYVVQQYSSNQCISPRGSASSGCHSVQMHISLHKKQQPTCVEKQDRIYHATDLVSKSKANLNTVTSLTKKLALLSDCIGIISLHWKELAITVVHEAQFIQSVWRSGGPTAIFD